MLKRPAQYARRGLLGMTTFWRRRRSGRDGWNPKTTELVRRGKEDMTNFRQLFKTRALLAVTALATVGLLSLSAHSVALAQNSSPAGAQSGSTAAKPSGDAKNGKAIYTSAGCYECHGREAQGGTGTGPRLGPSPLPYQAFAYQVRSPRDQMPPYTAKVVSDAQLADIYAFVQSVPQPPKIDSLPQLK